MTEQIPLSQDPSSEVFSDIFKFPWILLKGESLNTTAYSEMGARGSIARIVGLAIANSIGLFLGIYFLINGNPYIRLNFYLKYPPFLLAFILFPIVTFFLHSTAHFLCFRAVSGKGNLTAHSYLSALSAMNFVFVYWLAIIALYMTRSRGIDTSILIIGGLLLLIPSLGSLFAIHKISTGRFVAGIILSIIASIPLQLLYLFTLNFIAETRSQNSNIWLIVVIFICALAIAILIMAYMYQQRKFISAYPEGVPLKLPFKEIFKRG